MICIVDVDKEIPKQEAIRSALHVMIGLIKENPMSIMFLKIIARLKIVALASYHTQIPTKVSIKDFFSKCDKIHSFLRIWSHLLKKSLAENFILYAVHP